jgi:hypothetical protein
MTDATLSDLLGSGILMHFDASDSSSIFEDTGGTDAAEDGDTVKCWKPSSLASLPGNATEATNGPTYRANYDGSGYPALQFDGVNDLLTRTSTGNLTNGCKMIFCWTRINASTTVRYFQIGADFSNSFSAYRSGTNTDGIQVRGAGANTTVASWNITIAAGRQATVYSFVSGQLQAIGLGHGSGATTGASSLGVTYTNQLIIGNGNVTQFANMGLHEILVVSSDCELGQVMRAAKLIRTKWGITDPSDTPQQAASTTHNPFRSRAFGGGPRI